MGSICNRALPHVVTVGINPNNLSTIFGIGLEGMINGGTALNVTVDGSGGTANGVTAAPTAGAITITIFYRVTPTSALVADATTVNLPMADKVIIGLTSPNVAVYEIVMKAYTASMNPDQVIVSSETSRAS